MGFSSSGVLHHAAHEGALRSTAQAEPRALRRRHLMPDKQLIDTCVHCGFCLPACPTYQSWGEEMDSPRGRIYLMKGVVEGKLALDETVVRHIDACLGCMGCVTACPSGVKYDALIEQMRAEIESRRPRSAADRLFRSLIFRLFP